MSNWKNWLGKRIQETTVPQMPQNAQELEEFLRDVIAIQRGQESPQFWPDQNAVFEEAKKRGNGRAAINASENEWQRAKAEAAKAFEGNITYILNVANHRT